MKYSLLYLLLMFVPGVYVLYGQSDCVELIWSDEFDYSGLPDPARWDYDLGGGGWGNNEVQVYTNKLANASVDNGMLTIRAVKESEGWTSARLVSRNKGDWLYGRIEVRAKLPVGAGTWPAIWMLPTDWVYGGWPSSGEIDIMEHIGSDPGRVHGTVHTESYNHTLGTQRGQDIFVSSASSSFHVYAIEWTETEIKWFVDDQHYFTFENENLTYKEWPFDKRFHLLLNIAMGGWGGDIDPDLSEASMQIDYVRVYNGSIPDLTVSGTLYAEPGDTASFTVPFYNDFTYNWILPGGTTAVDGQGSHSVDVKWGNNDGEISVEAISPCNTYMSLPFLVRSVFVPSEDDLYLPHTGADGKLLWKVNETEGNTVELSMSGDDLKVDFNISDRYRNPYIYYTLERIINLHPVPKLYPELMIGAGESPANFRIDISNVNGYVNLNDLFKLDAVPEDGNFYRYVYEYGKSAEGDDNLSLAAEIRIYFNYSFDGKENSGSFLLKPLLFSNKDYNVYVGVEDIYQSGMKLYPNPARDYITVKTDVLSQYGAPANIYDQTGRKVASQDIGYGQNENIINISHLEDGLYILKIGERDKQVVSRFIKHN